MTITVAQLAAKVNIDGVDSAKAQLKDIGSTASTTGSLLQTSLAGALSFAAGVAGDAIGFLGRQLENSVTLAMAHEDVMQQTAQVIRSTGDASGMTTQALNDLADSLSQVTKFSNDTTQQGENLLLTFTGIGKDIFPQATKTMLDMSQALGQDVKSSAIQLGKALNDPLTGLSALSRVGVSFNDEQKKLIQTYMEHNEIGKAQGVMLQELQREFGGSAEAAGKTFGGQLTIAKDKGQELEQKIGMDLLPILNSLLQKFADPALSMAEQAFHAVKDAITTVITEVQQGTGPLGTLLPLFQGIVTGTQQAGTTLITQFGPAITTIATLLQGQIGRELNDVGSAAQQFGQWFQTSVVPALQQAAPGFLALSQTILTTLVPAIIQIRGIILDVIEHAFKLFGPIIEQLIPPLIRFAGVIAKDVSDGIKVATPLLIQIAKTVGDFADQVMTRIAPILKIWIADLTTDIKNFEAFWKIIWPGVQQVLQGVWNVIVGIVKIAWSLISGIILVGLDVLSGNWSQAWTDIQTMFAGIWTGIQQTLSGALQAVLGIIQTVWLGLSAQISQPFTDAWNTISGIIKNIQNAISTVTNIGGNLASGVQNAISGLLPGHANGIINASAGHWAMVGENGPEPMYVPQGASILPNSMLSTIGGSPHVTVQPAPIMLDGRLLASALMPYIADAIRYQGGHYGL